MQNDRTLERAKLFAPFDSLKGLFDRISDRERIVVDKKILCPDTLEELDWKIKQVKVGEMIKIIYYDKDDYVSLEGMVAKIDLEYTKTIQIVKQKINLEKIIQIDLD